MKTVRLDTPFAIASLCAALLGGCVMHTVTRGDADVGAHTIYRISEEDAFTTILGERQRSNPQLFAALTIQLQGLLDSETPLALAS